MPDIKSSDLPLGPRALRRRTVITSALGALGWASGCSSIDNAPPPKGSPEAIVSPTKTVGRDHKYIPFPGLDPQFLRVNNSIFVVTLGAAARYTLDSSEVWRQTVPGIPRFPPVVVDGLTLLSLSLSDDIEKPSGSIVALATDSGAAAWRSDLPDTFQGTPLLTRPGHVVFSTGSNEFISCIEIASGRLRWKRACGAAIQGLRQFDSSELMFATGIKNSHAPNGDDIFKPVLLCIDGDGVLRWKVRVSNSVELISLRENRLLAYMNNSTMKHPLLFTIDSATGGLLAGISLPGSSRPLTLCKNSNGEEHIVCHTIQLVNSKMTFRLASYSLAGKIRWEFPLTAYIGGQAVKGEVFSFATWDGDAYGINATSGNLVWHTKVAVELSDIVAGDSKLHVQTNDAKLMMIDRADGTVDTKMPIGDAELLVNSDYLFARGSNYLRPLSDAK